MPVWLLAKSTDTDKLGPVHDAVAFVVFSVALRLVPQRVSTFSPLRNTEKRIA